MDYYTAGRQSKAQINFNMTAFFYTIDEGIKENETVALPTKQNEKNEKKREEESN